MHFEHIISTKQFQDRKILEEIFQIAEEMERKGNVLQQSLRGKILASLFYEPSTRTRFSFEAAMQRLGGNVIATEAASQFSSVTKGETLEDTIKTINSYADVIVLRHPTEGSSQRAADVSSVPIINAGDGPGEHPTQALLDLYTIWKEKGGINNLSIAFVGDLLYGRTVHSLLNVLPVYDNVKFSFVSPPPLRLPDKYKEQLTEKGISFQELTDLQEVLPEADVLYVTRIQKERFPNEEEYEKVKDSYIIDPGVLEKMKPHATIMHPLPRVNEISPAVDTDKRAAYFRQVKNGLYVRMALLELLLKDR